MASQNDDRLVADQFSVALASPLDGGGGLAAYAAIDRHTGNAEFMAVSISRHAPACLPPPQTLSTPISGMLVPVAHGVGCGPAGEGAYYVIAPVPPGPPLAATLRPWSEQALIEQVLRPAAQVLDRLHQLGLTHRAIRLDNVFQQAGRPVVLGLAWTTPPAMHQPAQYEPPYSAMCLPVGRGAGTIADDVYALGVLMVALALGHVPLADLDDAAVVRRKLELGTYQALVGDARLPPLIGDLVRGMLAEDPDHRPTPALLQDPGAARGRRVAARPPRRAQRSLQFGEFTIWDVRTLAYAMAMEPDLGLQAVNGGAVTQWLRRGLTDAALGSRIEELVRHRQNEGAIERGADGLLVLRAIVALDPLAPLCWRGLSLWPDGLGPALAHALGADGAIAGRLEEVVMTEAIVTWAMLRTERCDFAGLRMDSRQHRAMVQIRGPAGGLPRLAYALCPLLPCGSPIVARSWVVRPADMAAALETAAATADRAGSPVDSHIAALLGARSERRLQSETAALAGGEANGVALARLRLLAQLQLRYDKGPLPALSAWMLRHCQPLVESWHNRRHRAALTEKLKTAAEAGYLPPIVGLLEDAAARSADEHGARQAVETVQQIDQELHRMDEAGEERALMARRIGQEIAAGAGLVALATLLVLAALT